MATTPSPLRYPGGKTSIFSMVSSLINENNFGDGDYAEPYAGGAGLALSLLFNDLVNEIHLNDIDRSIWSFWDAILNHTDKFINKINETKITMDEWHIQKEIQRNKDKQNNFDLAFSTFFLNRTNRSGIILKAGVIGGLKQEGTYKLDCRFNKKKLIEKIIHISQYRHRINIYNKDAIIFINDISEILPENSVFCIDPPYYNKGSMLYTNFYNPTDHQELANNILRLNRPWILTYDNTEEIKDMYKINRQYNFDINYSAAKKRKGTEVLIVSDGLIVPSNLHPIKTI